MRSNNPHRILIIVGTRPEAIKLAPIILAMQKNEAFNPRVLLTGQHSEMLDQVLEVFDINPDDNLELMRPNQNLSDLTSRAITALDAYYRKHQVDMILVQGDTTTAFVAALVGFYHKIKIGHVEAGLRTHNKYSPFPEEINRCLVTPLADFHFSPTETSRVNLMREGIVEDNIYVTGNTVIDALNLAVEKIVESPPEIPGLPKHITNGDSSKALVLITAHRRENFGKGIESICDAILILSKRFENVNFVYPVHLNPNVKSTVFRLLGDRKNVYLIEPISYLPFVYLMHQSKIILTDSGGIQEEAPSLGKPVLVMRDTTERPEAIAAGTVKLVGTKCETIIHEVSTLLNDAEYYREMANAVNPYGDGKATRRILDVIVKQLH